MRITFLAAAALLLFSSSARAQCNFNIGKARGLKASMVRAFHACPDHEHPPEELSATKAGIPACAPVEPRREGATGLATAYEYGPNGECSFSTSARLVPDCSQIEDANDPGNSLGLPAAPCHVTYVKSKCSGIVDNLGQPIGAIDMGWKLEVLSRVSMDDQVGGDMTVIDLPVTFRYSIPDGGRMEVDSNSAQAFSELLGTNAADLPPCTSIEILRVFIRAPGGLDGLPFAQLGYGTRPRR